MTEPTGNANDSRVGLSIAGRYRVEALLGEGGMGVVYLAEHIHMRKRFALKILHRELTHNPKVVARFEREAIAAGRIEHPNVVAAKDFGQLEDGSFYLVLEYVAGQSLRDLIKQGPLAPTRALGIARQIADALAAAHQAGIVHRDLKPDNVLLLANEAGKDRVKVLDFGIAKLTLEETAGDSTLTQAGSIFGTPEYMAPEQAMGQPVDARTDLYALGVVMYEMLSGHVPFEAGEAVAVLAQQMVAEPPPLPDSIDRDLGALVMSQLAKDPGGRAQSAQVLRDRIDQALARIEAVGGGELPLPSAPEASGSTRYFGSPARTGEPAARPNSPSVTAESSVEVVPSRPLARVPGPPTATSIAAAPLEMTHVLAFLRRGVRIKKYTVPLWVVLALLISGAVLMTSFMFSLFSHSRKGPALHSSAGSGGAGDVLSRARHGDPAAIAELEARGDEKDMDAETLLALGAGRVEIGQARAGIDTLTKALDKDKELASRPELLRAVRLAADDPDAWRDAVRLAANRLGAGGADLLWDVKQRATPGSSTANEASDLLQMGRMREVATPALLIAIELSKAKTCPDFKALLGRAQESADERSLPFLEKLAKKRGCGRRGRKDCFSCLRSGNDVEDAVEHARNTRAPSLFARSAAK